MEFVSVSEDGFEKPKVLMDVSELEILENPKFTAIKTGENKSVPIEDLLMKLAMCSDLLKIVSDSVSIGKAIELPQVAVLDEWTYAGIHQMLSEVQHVLTCGLYGYDRNQNKI